MLGLAHVYRLEIIDTEGAVFTIIGAEPLKVSFEEFIDPEHFDIGEIVHVVGVTGEMAIRKDKIKAMNLETLYSS